MSPHEILAQLSQQQIVLRAEGDRLHVRAPKGALTAELRTLISEHKPALLALLTQTEPAVRAELALSAGQRALWFLSQLVPDSSGYNVSLALLLRGPLSVPALERAIRRLGDLHVLLRARFDAPDGVPVMHIDPQQPLAIAVIEAQQWPMDQVLAQSQALSERPFRVGTEAASRLALFLRSPNEAVLLISIHHLVFDYWSLAFLIKDLWTLYEGERSGVAGPAAAPGASYADFVEWQQRFLQSQNGARQRDFWHKQLAGELPILDLPTDHPRPPVRSEQGDVVRAHLGQSLVMQLRQLAMAENTTPFAICLSGLVALLHRYTGQEEILLGTPYHGRSKNSFERVFGYFVNTLILRARVSKSMSFRELIRQMHTAVVQSLAHADYPFSLLVESLGPKRDASRNPIFSVMIDWLATADPLIRSLFHPDASAPSHICDLAVTPLPLRQLGGVADLLWMVTDLGDTLALTLGYSTDLFLGHTATSMLQSFVHLLRDGTQHPDKSILALEVVTESAHAIFAAHDGPPAVTQPGSVFELLAAQIDGAPDALALGNSKGGMTYRELDEYANQVAHYLRDSGVGSGSLVGLCVDQPRDLVASLLGVLKSGGACLVIDTLAAAEIEVLSVDLRDAILLTTSGLKRRLGRLPCRVLCLDTLAAEIARYSKERPPGGPAAGDLALVIYSQAQEAPPQGAMLEHGVVRLAVQQAVADIKIAVGSRVLLHGRRDFSTLPIDILMVLCAGGTLFLGDPVGMEESVLAKFLDEFRIATLIATAPVVASLPTDALCFLRRILVRGEPAAGAQFARLRQDIEVLGIYGHAETSHYAAVASYDPQETFALIGRPAGHATILVLDEAQQPVPPGVSGEVYIGGLLLARSHLGAERADRQVSHDAWSKALGLRLFRTGVLGRRRSDGTIEYQGRKSEQVLVGTSRVNLDRIASVCLSHPAVTDCCIVNRPEKLAKTRLVAYVKLAQGQRSTEAELLLHLRSRLPPLAVPAKVLFVDTLPLNRQGAVARSLLPVESEPAQLVHYVAPRDRLELSLVQIWERVLKRQPIGVRDDFFSLGGHSLLAVQVRVQVQQQLLQDFPLSVLTQEGTIEQLADVLRSRPQPGEQSPLVVLREGARPPLFLIHPIGGNVLCYVELARRFRTGDTIIGVQSSALEESGELPDSMEKLASDYVTAIRQRQPEGPYRIAGWSFGGILAFELAQQLTQLGSAVELLAIIDSVPPAMLGALNAMDEVAGLSFLRNRLHGIEPEGPSAGPTVLQGILADMAERGLLPDPAATGQIEQLLRVLRHHGQLLRSYSLRAYSGRLLLMLASERWYMPSLEISAAAWQALCIDRIETQTMPGNHFSILGTELSLKIISETLMAALDRTLVR